MARIRSIKPSIWTDEKFISLSRDARLLALGMISHADDEGRLFASVAKLAGDVFPADDLKPGTVRQWRDEIARTGFTVIYQVNGVEYAYFPNWSKHQRISKPQASILPSPSSSEEQSRNDSALNRGTIPHSIAERARNDSADERDPRARAVGDRRQETGVPATPDADKPRRSGQAEDPERAKHVGDVVASYVDGAVSSGQPPPPSSLRARVGKQARALLADGFGIEELIKSAYRMGTGEWNDLAVQVRKDAAPGAVKPGHQPYQNPPDSAYEEKL